MQVHLNINQLPIFKNAVVTIGTFDGVHLGHKKIIQQVVATANQVNGNAVLITFDPHPRDIISSDVMGVRLLTTLQEKTALLAQTGLHHLVVVPFTPLFAHQSANEYIKDFLVAKFKPHTLIIGFDHHFGRDRQGNYQLLQQQQQTYGYHLQQIPEELLQNAKISSTEIRRAILHNEITHANQLLGYAYAFNATVVHGDKIGRTIGYATANLAYVNKQKIQLADGVYAVTIKVNTALHKAMMSIGFRPTIEGTQRMVEVHIFNFNQIIYGQEVTVYTHTYLRAEKKFNGLDALKAQLHTDKVQAEAALEGIKL
jgi:riboflavin kinase / FMN adenylyltransferase